MERLARHKSRRGEFGRPSRLHVHTSQAMPSTHGILRTHHVQRLLQIIPKPLLVRATARSPFPF